MITCLILQYKIESGMLANAHGKFQVKRELSKKIYILFIEKNICWDQLENIFT